MTKFCKDCLHYGGHVGIEDLCTEPRNKRLDLVTGQMTRTDASWLRNLKDPDKCGPEGKWWVKAQHGPRARAAIMVRDP